MTNNTVTMSRELAEAISDYMRESDSPQLAIWDRQLRSILAAPIVEADGMGEAVALITVTEIDREYPSPGRNVYVTWLDDSDKNLSTVDKLYASPPAPVSVVLPERAQPKSWNKADIANCDMSYIEGWNACLDKAKELNK